MYIVSGGVSDCVAWFTAGEAHGTKLQHDSLDTELSPACTLAACIAEASSGSHSSAEALVSTWPDALCTWLCRVS